MIAQFHLRWQFAHLIEMAQRKEMLRLPVQHRPFVEYLFDTIFASDPWLTEKQRHYQEVHAAFLSVDAAAYRQALASLARLYPPTDNVDWRKGPPAGEDLVPSFATMAEPADPRVPIFHSDLWGEFDEQLHATVQLNAQQQTPPQPPLRQLGRKMTGFYPPNSGSFGRRSTAQTALVDYTMECF